MRGSGQRGREVGRGAGTVALSSELCELDFELSDKRRLLTLFIGAVTILTVSPKAA